MQASWIRTNSFSAVWLEHADRCWEAERENAERLNDRKRQILTASAALFGLGLYSVQWLRDPKNVSNIRWDCIAVAIRGTLALSLFFFGLSLVRMMVRRASTAAGNTSTASNSLELLPSEIGKLQGMDEDSSRLRAFALTYGAFIDLKQRNAKTAKRLEAAQQFFIYGICLVFLAVIAYIVSSYPPIFNVPAQ
jgi:hypothetical protein